MQSMNERQRRFADGILQGKTATQAYIDAGYSANGAAQSAAKLLRNPKIAAYIAERQQRAAERAELSVEYVLEGLRTVAERCMQGEPVRDSKGRETGEWTFQANAATNALVKLGEHIGMWPKRLTVTHEDRQAAQAAADALGVDPADVIAEIERELKEARAT